MDFVTTSSPLRAPKTWMWINAVCLAWSILLFIEIIFTLGPLDRLEGTRAYITYNFVTTLVWVVEVGLTVLDDMKQQSILSRWDLFELAVGLYFLIDSMRLFLDWYKADVDVGGESLDTLINFAAYVYQLSKLQESPVVGSDDYLDTLEDEEAKENTQRRDDYGAIDINEVTHSGQCIARISMRTLVMKKWKRIFWITYGNDKMLFFRSQVDFEEWAMNPHLSRNQREKLVKLRIDFEDPNKSTRKDTEQIKGFHASVVKHKFYKSTGNVQQFKLDKWTDQGPTIMAAFGSMNPAEIKEFHMIMSEMLQQNPMNEAYPSAMVDARDGDSSGHYVQTLSDHGDFTY